MATTEEIWYEEIAMGARVEHLTVGMAVAHGTGKSRSKAGMFAELQETLDATTGAIQTTAVGHLHRALIIQHAVTTQKLRRQTAGAVVLYIIWCALAIAVR